MRRLLTAVALAVILFPTNVALVGSPAPMECCLAGGESCECRTPTGLTRCPGSDWQNPACFSPAVLVDASSTFSLPWRQRGEDVSPTRPLSLSLPPGTPPPRA